MNVRIIQVDGKLPNLALMLLSAWHKSQGDTVTFSHDLIPEYGEPWRYDRVYASAIFEKSEDSIRFLKEFYRDQLVLGGTGLPEDEQTEMGDFVPTQFTALDYSLYPDFTASIGFSQRGCRLACSFCVVPKKEGRPYSVSGIKDIWRGEGYPRHIHLLDNDFFGNPEWKSVVREVIDGKFKICINQGINVRVINDEAAEALAAMGPWDDQFRYRRVYTAWDNLGQENAFFRGIDRLEKYGINSKKIMSYMLVGYADEETIDDLLYRYERMKERGIMVYPMVHNRWQDDPDRGNYYKECKEFQRWVIRNLDKFCTFDNYIPGLRTNR